MTVITETQARGILRGKLRDMTLEAEAAARRMRLPTKRAAWLRHVHRVLLSSPRLIVVEDWRIGTGKNETVELLTLQPMVNGRWVVMGVALHARTRKYVGMPLAFEITKHAIERRLQWTRGTDPVAAVRDMAPAARLWFAGGSCALRYEIPWDASDQALLAIEGGALVCLRSNDEDRTTIATTCLRDRDRWGRRSVKEAKLTLPTELRRALTRRECAK